MCGIAGIYIRDPSLTKSHKVLERFVNEFLLQIEHRGPKATGFVAVSSTGEVRMDKAPLTASKFVKEREELPKDSRIILLHTRLDTKGDTSFHSNNHPVIHKTCFTVHNGWVRNDDELFRKYEFDRNGQVDSEIISAMLYASNFDLEKMKEAFDEMEGAIACASIDPIRHPGKVILAKGSFSPLCYVDNPKFFIWASEKKAIREMWGKFIGTPPPDDKIVELGHRRMLVLTPDEVKEHHIPWTPKTSYSVNYDWEFDGEAWKIINRRRTAVTTTTITPAATSPSSFTITNEEIVSEVDKLRGDKRGKARLRSNMGVLTFGLQLGPWHKCKICESLVHKSDIKNSTKGELCVDCYDTWMELAAAKRNAELNKPDESNEAADKNVSTLFPQVVKDMFGIWAGNENWVHDMAMDELAKVTGFSVEALNYILFRMPKPDIIKIDGLEAWIEDVMDIYDVELDVAWDYYDQNYNWEEPVEILLSGSATKSTEKPASEVVEQKALPAPKYVVRLQTVPSRGCRFCRRKIKCSVKRQVTSEFAGYCNRHFHVCGTEGCKETANHTRHDGIRVCHFHARGIKSAYSDTTLRNEGFLVGKEI